jgi:Ca2+-binding EF-hand superfamily protein
MTTLEKPSTPRESKPVTPRQGTPRSSQKQTINAEELDPKIVQLVWTSLKDRIYQRSNNLRHTYRELDAKGDGMIPIPDFVEEMGRAYQLSPVERACLALLLKQADFRRDGLIDFREFVEMLKVHSKVNGVTDDDAELTPQERRRFDRCALDKKMQHVVIRDETRPIKIIGHLPTNELGSMSIDTPYGVLGDSERMDAVIASFLNIKYEKLRTIFAKYDKQKDGRVNHIDFRIGMKELDPYVFDDEIDYLIIALDKKKRGFINIAEFADGLGREYLKKKAHRSQAHENPFQWPIVEKKKPTTANSELSPRQAKVHPLPQARSTRATNLRNHENREKLDEIHRREEGIYTARAAAGTANAHAIPKPPKASPRGENSESTKLPQIHSARRGSGQ